MLILGIDPGLDGALAFFRVSDGNLSVVDMPTVEVKRGKKSKREIEPATLARWVTYGLVTHVVVERVNASPQMGVTSAFSFGRSMGVIEGIIAARSLPVTYVQPAVWTKVMRTREGKDGSRLRAIELFPNYGQLFARKKDDGRADAALLAYWYAMQVS
jgi:crossover junction endodeoxyribonuclease RuvC